MVAFERAVIETAPVRIAWTPRDLTFLSTWWGVMPDRWIAERIPSGRRSPDACKIAATRRLHQSRMANVITGGEVARIFGVDATTPYKNWAKRGWLHPTKGSIGAGRNSIWVFTAEDLARFVTEHSEACDPARMQHGHWLTTLAAQQWRDPWLTVDEVAQRLHFAREITLRWIHRLHVPIARQPHSGSRHGPWQGRIVLRESALPDLARQIAEVTAANRSAAAVARAAAKRHPTGVMCEGCGAVELLWPQRRSCSKRCKGIVDRRTARAGKVA